MLAGFGQSQKALEKVNLIQKLINEEGMENHANYIGRLAYDAFSISFQTTKKNLGYYAKLTIDNLTICQGEFNGGLKRQVYSYYKK